MRHLFIKFLKDKYYDAYQFILIVACIAAANLIRSDIVVLSVFLGTLVVYVLKGYDCRMLIVTAIALLVIAAVFLALDNKDYANKIAVQAYYFLAIGTIGLVIEHIRESREGQQRIPD
jgi:hypothetical protein